ncbi:MAG: ankyrin repeat domain-containing protein [Phycisphaerales bacterium]
MRETAEERREQLRSIGISLGVAFVVASVFLVTAGWVLTRGNDRGANASGVTADMLDAPPPLFAAAIEDDASEVTRLLAAGDDPNTTVDFSRGTPQGGTALFAAAIAGSPTAARALIDGGAAVDARLPGGRSALCFATTSVIPVLIEAGANPNAPDDDGMTALFPQGSRAMQTRDARAFALLVELGADPDHRDGRGRTVQSFLVGSGEWTAAEVRDVLGLDAPDDVTD